MKKIILGVVAGALVSTAAHAGPMWESFSFRVAPKDAAAVVEATDKFMNTDEGKAYEGKLVLMANIANGDNPATHSYVALNASAAAAEAWGESAQNSKAWADYMKAVAGIMEPVSEGRFRFVKSWGAPNNDNNVWQNHMIRAKDPAAVVAAMDTWFASAKGSQFPGEAHLSSPIAMGPTKMSHLVSIGFTSEAAMEEWADSLAGNADYEAFLASIGEAADYMGATLSREVKEWGEISTGDE